MKYSSFSFTFNCIIALEVSTCLTSFNFGNINIEGKILNTVLKRNTDSIAPNPNIENDAEPESCPPINPPKNEPIELTNPK